MVMRKCPNCGKQWYSAYEQGVWECDCGQELEVSLNENSE